MPLGLGLAQAALLGGQWHGAIPIGLWLMVYDCLWCVGLWTPIIPQPTFSNPHTTPIKKRFQNPLWFVIQGYHFTLHLALFSCFSSSSSSIISNIFSRPGHGAQHDREMGDTKQICTNPIGDPNWNQPPNCIPSPEYEIAPKPHPGLVLHLFILGSIREVIDIEGVGVLEYPWL